MRVLVTGAAGFIGSNTVEQLVADGHDVLAVDDLSAGHADNVPKDVEFLEANCGDPIVAAHLGGIDACVHFAARIEPGDSVLRPEEFFENNVATTFRLARYLVDAGVSRLVYSSSCAVYGSSDRPLREDNPKAPVSPYGQSKLMVDEGLETLARLGRLRSASMRYFNAAGGTPEHPEHHVPESHLIPLALAAANGDRPEFAIFGSDYDTPDGTCIRDYVHVRDLAVAHVAAISALEEHDHLTVNLGSGVGSSNREVVAMVRQVTGRDVVAPDRPRRAGDPAIAIADNTCARDVLGWTPATSLETIVKDAWDGYQLVASRS